MTWYRAYKTFQGGQSDIGYFEVDKYSPKDIVKDAAEYWAENTLGGENYGWTVYWTRAKKPANKWLKWKIEQCVSIINGYKERLEQYKDLYKK